LIVVEAVVENSKSRPQRCLSISEHVPRQTNPRSGLNAWSIENAFLVLGHALKRRAGRRRKCADLHRRKNLAGRGIQTNALAAGRVNVRLNERRLLAGVVSRKIERCQSISRTQRRLDEIEPDTGINRQSLGGLPGILAIPLDIDITPMSPRMLVGFFNDTPPTEK